jgi:HSP20 family protein
MPTFRWNSLQELIAIQEKMNRLFEEAIYPREFSDDPLNSPSLWSPPADAYESSTGLVFHVEIPGVALEDVKLEAEKNKLRLSGTRRESDDNHRFLRMERVYGDFYREFVVPEDIDPSAISATLEGGILKITAPKLPPSGRKTKAKTES